MREGQAAEFDEGDPGAEAGELLETSREEDRSSVPPFPLPFPGDGEGATRTATSARRGGDQAVRGFYERRGKRKDEDEDLKKNSKAMM